MRFYVAVTDNSWFDYLSHRQPEEVNFWRPSGKGFEAIAEGALFLFKLHSPRNYIAGGGFFISATQLPLSLAWDAFGEKNGAANLSDLRGLIRRHRGGTDLDPFIGCIILGAPFFLPESLWIPVPTDWATNIVTGKSYNSDDQGSGKQLWDRVMPLALEHMGSSAIRSGVAAEDEPVYGQDYLARIRLGQGTFRVLVTDAYNRQCSITGERTLPVLQAAHIKPVAENGPNRIDNGLLMRSDLHILFDRGYVTISPGYRIEMSHHIKEDFDNGKEYYKLHGQLLMNLPQPVMEKPNVEFLKWHNDKVFLR